MKQIHWQPVCAHAEDTFSTANTCLQARHLAETHKELQLLRVTREVQAALIAAPLPAKKGKGSPPPLQSASAQEISNLENSLEHAAR